MILLLGIFSVLFGLVALGLGFVKPRYGLIAGVVALAFSCSVPGMGVIGMVRGRQVIESAISGASVNPEQKARIRAEGYRESGECTTLGLGVGALPLLLALAALGVGLGRRK